MKCPNCDSRIHFRDSVQRPDGTHAYKCPNCERISKAKHGLPFFILVFAIIVPLGDWVLSGIVESFFSAIWGGDTPEESTIRIVSIAVSIVLFIAVFRILNTLEFAEEKNSDNAKSA